jgi:hypothetical protein
MRTPKSSIGVALVVTLLSGWTQTQASKAFTGRWEGDRQAENRVDHVAIVITDADKGLAGQVFLNGEVFDAMSNIVVDGKKIAFDVGNMSFTGAIDGKTLTLTGHFDGRDLWTMALTKRDQSRPSLSPRSTPDARESSRP